MSTGEEYDPATGTFRPIAQPTSAKPAVRDVGTKRALSEAGERYGVMYEVFSDAFRTNQARYLEYGAKAVMVIVFVLLLYEAISYRIALS